MDNSSSQKVNKRTNGVAESSTYLCVICDITVPNIYWKSHNDSLKHKTCLEIANVSMQRVRKNMFAVPPHYSTSDSNYYFCGACAVPIAVTEKIYHTSTKEHADAVKHDELLSNLLDIYKNKSKLSNNDTTISTVHVHAKNKNNNTTEVNRTKDRNQVIKVKPDNNVCAINITSEDNNKNRELYVLKEHIDYVNEKLEIFVILME
ncbi:uncharacterized protein LOC131849045 [Achroia grisella]|uniref:uncharacterized protein LOC131849045 n=1 Tax=Achroia grisella TaxID=688607 RepID=UPI0027D2D49C|nr:uncharacterized protein LOC131849045 [Achroia grisella]